jgi:PAS domain S-box-containing protein
MREVDKKTILLVDDEPFIMLDKKQSLKQFGYNVVTANSGEKAVDLALSDDKIHLILMDIDLGAGIDGTEAAKQILAKRSLPIMFHTSHAEREMVEKVRGITRYGYVLKTASPFILESTIEMAFHLFQAHQQLEKQMEELKQSDYLYRNLMKNVQEGVILVDSEDKILFVNPYFCKVIGYQSEELVGRTGYEILVIQEEKDFLKEKNKNRLKGISEQYELTMMKKNGEPIIFFMNASPVYDEKGDVSGSMATCLDITEKKKVEQQARDSEKMLRLILDTIPARVFIKDRNLDYLDCNLAFAKDAGLERTEDIVGKSDFDLCWHSQAKLYRDFGQTVMTKNEPLLNVEEPQELPDGTQSWVKTNLIPLRKDNGECIGLLGTYEDITARITAQHKLFQSEITYRGMLDSIEESIYIQDENGIFLDVNSTVEKFYNYKREYFIGKSPQFLSAEGKNDLKEIAVAVKKAYEGIPQRFEFWGKRHDGSIFPKEVSVSPCVYFGKKAVIAVARDISERKEKEKQILKLLQEKEALLKEVHHRIKNNMNIICSLLSLQIKTTDEESLITALRDAQSRIQSMMVLYDKLYRSTHFKNISSQEFLSSLVDEIMSIFPRHTRVNVIKNFQRFDLPEKKISALGIIIGELLTNAMKYAYQGRENGSLTITSHLEERVIRFVIKDDGNGLPKNFDIETSGGFGLKLVHMLASQLDGKVCFRNAKQGSEFIIEFPVE